MKIVIVFFLLFVIFLSCDNNTPEDTAPDMADKSTPLPDAFKGYELYSWEAGGQWKYTLITGTNRIKTYDEIVSKTNVVDGDWVKITVTGSESLKQLLLRLSAPEDIGWVSTPIRVAGF